ncbi:MAG: phosphoribosylanthranilate isomerase [Saprospiraceae bacterium]
MKIKVCGMRESKNIQALSVLEVDYMGLIFYEKSKRFVAREIAETLLKKVGIFVNEEIEKVEALAKEYQLHALQVHGDESPEYCKKLQEKGHKIFRAFRVDENFDFQQTKDYEPFCELFIFDAKGKDYGGNGIAYDWSVLEKYQGGTNFLLSGGINPNSIEKIQVFQHPKCLGLDLNSGFEIEPALKDIDSLKIFIDTIQEDNRR